MVGQIRISLLLIGFAVAFFHVDALAIIKSDDYAAGKIRAVAFRASLKIALSRRALKTTEFCDESDPATRRFERCLQASVFHNYRINGS